MRPTTFITFLLTLTIVKAKATILWSDLNSGDLIFLDPKPTKGSDFDDAILSTGLATIKWMEEDDRYPPSITNEIASHVGIVWKDEQDSSISIVQALPGQGVILKAKDDFVNSIPFNSTTIYLGLPNSYVLQDIQEDAASIAYDQIGLPYADGFEKPPNSFYCSSLINYAFQLAAKERSTTNNLEDILAPSDFVLLFSPEEYWEEYYENLGMSVPVNVTGNNPTLVLHSYGLEFQVFDGFY